MVDMLNNEERKLVASVPEGEIERILVEAVKIPSYSPPTGHEQDLAEFFERELKSLGISTELDPVQPSRPNVLAYLKGGGTGRSVLFNGHTDTSPPVMGWRMDPHAGVQEGDRVYGHGVSNMKGSDVAMIAAMAALRQSAIELSGDVILSLVIGECRSGQGTKHMLSRGMRADYFVNGEPTNLNILTLCAGKCNVRIAVKGRAHHYSVPGKGINAIEKMMEILSTLGESNTPIPKSSWLRVATDKPEYEGFPRFNIGVIKGGLTEACLDWGPYHTPDFCVATIDVRYPPGLSPKEIQAQLQGWIAEISKRDKEVEASVEVLEESKMPPYEIRVDAPIVSTVRAAARDVLGRDVEVGAIEPLKFMAADAGSLQAASIPGVVLGAGTFPGSIPGEYVEISKVVAQAKIYALTAYRVTREPR